MKNTTNLRFVFVQMLFALAVGQVALKSGEIINLTAKQNLLQSIIDYHYIYAHLLLTIIILSTSWVGWQISQSVGNTEKINSIFSLQYIVLLIDIFLVISYFVIVRGTEIDTSAHAILDASIFTEAFWSLFIFCIYFFWDIITKLIIVSFDPNVGNSYKRNRKFNWSPFFSRTWQTIFCIILSLFIFFCTKPTLAIQVTAIDFSVIFIFLMFRGFKQTTKRIYHVVEDQIPEAVIKISGFTKETNYPITVKDGKFILTFIIVKILPLLLFITSMWVYYTF